MKHLIFLISVLFVIALIALFAQKSTKVGTAANNKNEMPQDTFVAKQPTQKTDTLKYGDSITRSVSNSNIDTHIANTDTNHITPKATGNYTNDTTKLSGDSTKIAKKIFIVNDKKCIGCRICVNKCPDAIKIQKNGKAEIIDPEKVGKCGGKKLCPFGAIEVKDVK